MIVEIIVYIIGRAVQLLGQFFPGYDSLPLQLPWGLDDMVTSGVNGYKVLALSFPPFQVVLTAFLIYLGFRLALKALKAIPLLGRTLE